MRTKFYTILNFGKVYFGKKTSTIDFYLNESTIEVIPTGRWYIQTVNDNSTLYLEIKKTKVSEETNIFQKKNWFKKEYKEEVSTEWIEEKFIYVETTYEINECGK